MIDFDGTFTVQNARYAKGKIAVHCHPNGTGLKTRAARLAAAISRHRYTNRERSYIMSPTAAVKFVRLFRDGYDANPMTDELEAPAAT